MRKHFYLVLFLSFCCIMAHLIFAQDVPESDYQKLEAEYEKILRDRDNLLIQIQNLDDHRVGMQRMKDEVARLEEVIKSSNRDKDELLREMEEIESHISLIQKEKGGLVTEIENLKKHIENKEVDYKIIEKTKAGIRGLEVEKQRLERLVLSLGDTIKKLRAEKVAVRAESEIYLKYMRSLKKQYAESVKINKRLEKQLEAIPKKFAEIARENKLLLKETALMHYNMGVFYLEEGTYRRAIAELEKAVELNPNDAYAYFNLGYIYAEHHLDRPKAIKCFQQYLKLAGREDKERDWVKKYILTWQAWEGGKPIK